MNKGIVIAIVTLLFFVSLLGVCHYLGDDEKEVEREEMKFERFEEIHSKWKAVYDNFWTGQIFTIGATGENEKHTLTRIDLYVAKVGIPKGLFTLSIRETEEVHPGWYKPIGDDLASTSIPCAELPDTSPKWVSMNFTEELTLDIGKTYAWIVSAPDVSTTEFPRIERVEDEGTYPGGHAVTSQTSGESWGVIIDDDYVFKEYGYK